MCRHMQAWSPTKASVFGLRMVEARLYSQPLPLPTHSFLSFLPPPHAVYGNSSSSSPAVFCLSHLFTCCFVNISFISLA